MSLELKGSSYLTLLPIRDDEFNLFLLILLKLTLFFAEEPGRINIYPSPQFRHLSCQHYTQVNAKVGRGRPNGTEFISDSTPQRLA